MERINSEFWKMDSNTARSIFLSTKCKSQPGSVSFSYLLPDKDGVNQRVCLFFLLSTLGYSSNKVISNLSSKLWEDREEGENVVKVRKMAPAPDQRGRQPSGNKIKQEDVAKIREYIRSYNPQASHYQRVNAPNRLYISSEATTNSMFQAFSEKNPDVCGRSR